MTLYIDKSYNGAGVDLNDSIGVAVNPALEPTVNAKYIRVTGAGNLVLRFPGGGPDVTIAAAANEYVPVAAGVIVLSSTTATGLVALGNL